MNILIENHQDIYRLKYIKNLHREHREDTERHRVLISNRILAPRPWERGWGEAVKSEVGGGVK